MNKKTVKVIVKPFYIGKEKAETVIKRVIEDEIRRKQKKVS